MNEVYVNLKEQPYLDELKRLFKKDLVSVGELLDNLDEALETIEIMKKEIKRLEGRNEDEFRSMVNHGCFD